MTDGDQPSALSTPSVAIVGAGWSGLACAFRLTQSGFKPLLLESAPEPGGRARRALFTDHLQKSTWRDNGQHLMLAGCHAITSLCEDIGVELPQTPFHYTDGDRQFSLKGRGGQLGLLLGLFSARGFSWQERQRLFQALVTLKWHGWQVSPRQTVQEWLVRSKQPNSLIRDFWSPLALAILNTPPDQAAMTRLAPVLRDTLGAGCDALAIRQPYADLSTSVVTPLVNAINKGGGQIRCGQRVKAIHRNANNTAAAYTLTLHDGTQIAAEQVVLALPPWSLSRLDLPFSVTGLAECFGTQPIATVYLGFEPTLRLTAPLVQIAGPTPEDARVWAMDRAHCGEPGVIAVSLSAEGPWTALDNETLARRCLQHLLPLMATQAESPRCLWHKVVTVHRATFAATPLARISKEALMPLPGIYLTGDWTHPEYPATLEAAVASGETTAGQIIRAHC